MGTTKIRQRLAFGSTSWSEILFGQVNFTSPSCAAESAGTATAAIAGLDAGAAIYVTAGSLPAGMVLTGASATAANTVTLKLLNTGSASAASALCTLNYLAMV